MDELFRNVRTVLTGQHNASEVKELALKSLVHWHDSGLPGAADLLKELAIPEQDIENRRTNEADRVVRHAFIQR